MKHKFNELNKGVTQSGAPCPGPNKVTPRLATIALACLIGPAPAVPAATLGPLIELSRPNPVGTCDDGYRLPGTMTPDDAAETYLAVNPVNPNNIVVVWIQGPIQNNIAGVTLDGGATWTQVPLPMTLCSGGPYLGAGDPWLSFTPKGELYCVGLAGQSPLAANTVICKSTDGGLHWSAPVIVDTPDFGPDKCTITADPTDGRYVYAVWTRPVSKKSDALVFTRTTGGGQTWEPARPVLVTSPGQFAWNPQILVQPDGTLVYAHFVQNLKPNRLVASQNLQFMCSTDKGQTWSNPTPGPEMQTMLRQDTSGYTLTVDPDTGQLVRDTTNPSLAVDSRKGTLYAVWEDGRFSNFQYNDIAFSMSSDGGLTWSSPIRINQTPLNIPQLNRQTFYPTIAVSQNGTIGVSYYDFRLNTPAPGVPTDYWLVQCRPSSNAPATDPANWGGEVRLTSASFNLEALPLVIDGYWFGDYLGLAAVGGQFFSSFGAVDQDNLTSIFYRSVQQ